MNVLPDAWAASFVTSVAAMIVLTVVAVIQGRLRRAIIPPSGALRDLFLSGVLSSAALGFFFQSMNYIPVSVATPVNGTQALFAALFGWLLNDSVEHVRGKLVGASIIVLAGVALVVVGQGPAALHKAL